jgi:hypothetical protein
MISGRPLVRLAALWINGSFFLRCELVLMQEIALKVNKIERSWFTDITVWDV